MCIISKGTIGEGKAKTFMDKDATFGLRWHFVIVLDITGNFIKKIFINQISN